MDRKNRRKPFQFIHKYFYTYMYIKVNTEKYNMNSCSDYLVTGRNEVVAKVIFLHLSVIHSVHRGGCLSACWDTTPPPGAEPRSRHPPEQTPPWSRHPPPWEAHSSIRSTSGRYASYWNAFLLVLFADGSSSRE